MSLKDLIVRSGKRKLRPAPAEAIIAVLSRFGVGAPVTIAAAITRELRKHRYNFATSRQGDE